MKNVINLSAIALLVVGGLSMMLDTNEAYKDLASDSYKVIRVNGKIEFVKTKSSMKQGDNYVVGTGINFSTDKDRAAIINKVKGRSILQPSKKGKPIVLPAANNINSRSGALINKIDIMNHFSENYLVIGKMMVEVSAAKYVQNEKNFFYLAYQYKKNPEDEGELIRKKIPFQGNKMILDRSEIFMVDNQPVPVQDVEMSLYYMDGGSNSGEKLAKFNPVFPDLENLKSEILIILAESSENTKEGKIREITAYLNNFYGKPQKENVTTWLESEFDI